MRRPSARGLTLLELLIVLALLLAMAALVGPAALNALDERAFESATDVTQRQMMLARAHAQATGKPVEVVYVRNQAGARNVVARLFEVSEDQQQEPLVESWASRTLPFAFSMSDREPRVQDEPRIGGLDDAAVEATMLRLGVFLPDGSAMAGSPRWMLDDDGRAARLHVNPYTGEVSFTRLPPEDLRNVAAQEESDTMQWELR